jgi:hypothetical protein
MSGFYNPQRKSNLCNHLSTALFRLSRSKIDLFINCPRCFYLDRKLGIAQPPGYPFSLNSALDKLLKKEFDIHRANGTKHPFCDRYGIDAILLSHEKGDEWRDSLRGGITFRINGSNVVIMGGVDDMWVSPEDEYIIVDYKAAEKDSEVTLDADWQLDISVRWRYTNGYLGKTDLKFQTPDILFTVTATQIKRLLTEGSSLT